MDNPALYGKWHGNAKLFMQKLSLSKILLWFVLFLSPTIEASQNDGSNSPSQVCLEESQNSALMVIDMQPFFLTFARTYQEDVAHKIEALIAAQVATIKRAKQENLPILIIEYECGLCDPTYSELRAEIGDYKFVKSFKKNADSAFSGHNTYRDELVGFLQENSIGTLMIVGAHGGACVMETIKDALLGSCNVKTLSTGIADYQRAEFEYPYLYREFSPINNNWSGSSFSQESSVENLFTRHQ